MAAVLRGPAGGAGPLATKYRIDRLDLAGRPAGPPARASLAEAGSPRPRRSTPPLDLRRRDAAPAAAPAQPAPRAGSPPAPPAIDVDALSRDVISRIEQRLRIERERRGRA